jgi:hypothetical protein
MFGLNRLTLAGVAVLLLLASHVAAYSAGWFRGVASERAAWTLERERLIAEAAVTAERLRGEGKRLAAELEVARAAVRVEYVEKIREVKVAASRTKACFTPDVTAILNRASTIRERVERPSGEVRTIEHRSEAAPAGTSEAAAAEWVANAQAAHEACRAQVGALADWIRALTGGKS